MNDYPGPERRSVEQIQKVSIDRVDNGAEKQLEEMLWLLRKVCEGIEKGAKWARRVGVIVGIGTASLIFGAGMWYFKVDTHVESDEAAMAVQDQLIHEGTVIQARTLGLLEGMERRLTLLERRQP